MNKAAIILMLVTIISKILGFGREIVLASVYGTSMYSDAYLTAMNIPTVILTSIGAALATTFIPIYTDINSNFGEKKSLTFTNNIFNIVTILCIIFTILGLIFTKELVSLFAFGFNEETLAISVRFTKILLLGLTFTGVSNIMTSFLQVKGNFIVPGSISIPYNFLIIISMILSIKYGPYIMIWGSLIGMISQFIFQIPFSIRKGYKYKLYININDVYIKKTVCLLGPVFIGVAVNQINALVDRNLASTLVEGSISAINYANRLNDFVIALFITSISTVIYPILSKLSSENNKEEFIKSVVQSINYIILLVVPISIGAIVLAEPIVKLLFERGNFNVIATRMTSKVLTMYSIGMVASGLRVILGKVFYSIQDTKTPMINGAIAMVMNIILNIILVRYFDIEGLALSTSISAIICIFLLFNSLKKKIGYFGQDKIINTTLKSIVSAVAMGVITSFGYDLISGTLGSGFIYEAISLFGSILLGVIAYGVLVVKLKVEEISVITDMINKKIVKKAE